MSFSNLILLLQLKEENLVFLDWVLPKYGFITSTAAITFPQFFVALAVTICSEGMNEDIFRTAFISKFLDFAKVEGRRSSNVSAIFMHDLMYNKVGAQRPAANLVNALRSYAHDSSVVI